MLERWRRAGAAKFGTEVKRRGRELAKELRTRASFMADRQLPHSRVHIC